MPAGRATTNFAARAAAEFQRAQIQWQSGTNDSTAAWQFARACFDFADFATNDTGRAAIARQGIAACRELLARETNSAPGHYYLAMNYGQLARAEAPSLAAYRLVKQMEREFKAAADLDKPLIMPARSAASVCCIATRPAGPSASAAAARPANGWSRPRNSRRMIPKTT